MIPSAPIEFWQYFDVISLSIIFLVVGSLLVLHCVRRGSFRSTISEALGSSTASSRIFTAVMSICFPLYYAFLWFWIAPGAGLPNWAYALILVSAIAEFIFVWVPSTDGRRKLVHGVAAAITAVGMLTLPALILLYIDSSSSILFAAVAVFYVLSLTLLVLLMRNTRHVFVYETAFILYFLALMSFVGHVYIS